MKVAIVGGGIIGCAVALELRDRGLDVVVLERSVPGGEASSAAAGILGAQMESHAPGPLLDLLLRARSGYAQWSAHLVERTGVDVGYRATGVLKIARTDEEHAEVAHHVAWQRDAGLRAELLGARGAHEVEPSVARDVQGAAWFPDDAQVDPPRLLRALVAASARAGVELRAGMSARELIVEGGRCAGVVVDDDEVRADATVVAAGSWSSALAGLPRDVPAVRPVRGQMIQLDERPPRLRTIVVSAGAYCVPRGDGRVVCGSTLEHVGHRREVTAGGLSSILGAALAAVPGLGSAEAGPSWCNFRPYTASQAPLLGASTLPGLFLATGHHRNGILLARVTAELLAGAILQR